jgi:hypothetical protein
VVDVVLRVVQRRLTTAERLGACLATRRSHPYRHLRVDVLADTASGVQTPLERRWVRAVERAHGLPVSAVNRPDDDGRRRYRDVEYLPWGLVCEVDGREAHPDDERFRDRRRDNRVTVSGRRKLRYGWANWWAIRAASRPKWQTSCAAWDGPGRHALAGRIATSFHDRVDA